jgi:GT2 family glycosyltransferase
MDNRRDPDFSHQRELNKAILTADGPIITLDDDVIVSGNWYQALLYQARCNVGFVACSASDSLGRLRTRGATFTQQGKAVLWRGDMDKPAYVPCSGSFCCLLNVTEWPAGLRFSLEYKKYCFDPDLCFQLWEHGLSCIAIPETIIHESGGAIKETTANRAALFQHDERVFKAKWIDTRRLQQVYDLYSG